VADLLDHWEDARIKLWVTAALLRLRRDRPATFGRGRYLPLDVHGPAADHVVAFARTTRSDTVVTVVPRLTYGLAGPGCFAVGPVWGRTTIDLGPRRERWWRDVLSGQTLSLRRGHLTLADALAALPVAVLVPASPAAFRRPVTG
jgi:maltooligosyltrehalose synthase